MKGFFSTLVVVCLILGGLWFAYDPYIKPLLEGESGMVDSSEVIEEETAPLSTDPAPEKKGTTPAPQVSSSKPNASAPKEKEKAAPKSELDLLIEEKYPMPKIIPLMEIVDNWRNVPARAFPTEVIAKESVAFQLIVDGQAIGSSNVAPGTPLKPQSLSGDQLLLANAANPGMSTTIAVDKTDFKERITQRYDAYVERVSGEILAKRARVKEVIEADPSKMAALTGEAPAAAQVDASDPRMNPVKTSLQSGEVASVKLEEATSFTWNGSETIGGKFAGTYETVTVRFEVATIFGTFPVNYKCLLQRGRVVAWIDPITEDPV
ncbi:MAG: hypothetical protein AAF733_06055 [Verrucomicrobiota bacterium]